MIPTAPATIAPSAPPRTTPERRLSLWLMAAGMVLVVGLKSVPHLGIAWHWFGFPLIALALLVGWRDRTVDRNWPRVLVLLTYTIAVLWFTRIDGDTGDAHVVELVVMLGIGILLVPALAAEYWLREPLDYSWIGGRWSPKMWLWLPMGFVLAYVFMWIYFNVLTPTLHHRWPLPPRGDPT